jgi:predicted DsbA family dithiol-disulfide isomerase
MRVEIWSDLACPWCYIGKRRLEAALARFEHPEVVEVTWRSFELDPASPRLHQGDPTRALAAKYGVTLEQAAAFQAHMTEVAASEGLAFDLLAIHPGNTFDAHRLLHLAADQGLGDALHERLFAAYLCEGQPIGDRRVLLGLAAEAGIDPGHARGVLDSDSYASQVRAEEAEAAALGITAVPFFVIDRTYAIPGAQPPELLLGALRRAWEEQPERQVRAGAARCGEGARVSERARADEGVACEGDSCALS